MAGTPMPRRDTSSVPLSLFSSGGFLVLSGVVFLSPFVLSPNAIQNDVYLSNLFIGSPLLLSGAALLLASLLVARAQGRTLAWGEGLVLALAGGGVLALLYVLVGGHYVSAGTPINWPPYLTGPVMIGTLVVDLAVFLVACRWGEVMNWQPKRQGMHQRVAGV